MQYLAAILIGLSVAALIGLANGLIVTKLKVEPFIATLAMMIFARGITYLYTGGYPINFKPIPADFAWFGEGISGNCAGSCRPVYPRSSGRRLASEIHFVPGVPCLRSEETGDGQALWDPDRAGMSV